MPRVPSKFIDLDRVAPGLPDSYTNKEPDEQVKKRLVRELNSPNEKALFQTGKRMVGHHGAHHRIREPDVGKRDPYRGNKGKAGKNKTRTTGSLPR